MLRLFYCAENEVNKPRSGDYREKCLAKFLHANVTSQVKQISANPHKSENVLWDWIFLESSLNYLEFIGKMAVLRKWKTHSA